MFTKVAKGAKPIKRATAEAAGYDLSAFGDHELHVGINVVKTGISLEIPVGYCGIVKLRSGWSRRTGCLVTAGVIDSDYRGEIMVLVHSFQKLALKDGETFAQIVILRIATPDPIFVDELTQPDVPHYGFGSTDKVEAPVQNAELSPPSDNIMEIPSPNLVVTQEIFEAIKDL